RRFRDWIGDPHLKRDTGANLAQPRGAHYDGCAFRCQRLGHGAKLPLAVSPLPVLIERDPAVDQLVRLGIGCLLMTISIQEDDPTEIGEGSRCCSLVPDP